jgi:hypothetical protein
MELWYDSEKDGSSSRWDTSRREEGADKELRRKDCGKVGDVGEPSSVDPYETEMELEEEEEEEKRRRRRRRGGGGGEV